jgi:phosphate starvation-inducible PhoH-like protein
LTDLFTVVIEEQQILHNLCGANDANLKTLEALFEYPVYCRGNELLLKATSKSTQTLFRKVIDQLMDHTRDGQIPGPDLIKAVFRSVKKGENSDNQLLKDYPLHIAHKNQKVFPRSINQALYIKTMEERDITFAIGPAGTGKTYLAVAYAMNQILSKKAAKLVLTRPVVEAGESLGFLPGDFTQKISPYLRPLYDALDVFVSVEMITRMEEHRVIEIAPLAYMRGRNLANSIILLDEAQNTTVTQMKMFLTRLGEGSKAIITGDITQIDLPGKHTSGLLHVVKILQEIDGIDFIFFNTADVVRNPLVKKIIEAYEHQEEDS